MYWRLSNGETVKNFDKYGLIKTKMEAQGKRRHLEEAEKAIKNRREEKTNHRSPILYCLLCLFLMPPFPLCLHCRQWIMLRPYLWSLQYVYGMYVMYALPSYVMFFLLSTIHMMSLKDYKQSYLSNFDGSVFERFSDIDGSVPNGRTNEQALL